MNAITMHKNSTSPNNSNQLSSAESFYSNEDNKAGSEPYENQSQTAILDNLSFEKIEEYTRLKEIKLKKLNIQSGLSKETKNQIKISQQVTAR